MKPLNFHHFSFLIFILINKNIAVIIINIKTDTLILLNEISIGLIIIELPSTNKILIILECRPTESREILEALSLEELNGIFSTYTEKKLKS